MLSKVRHDSSQRQTQYQQGARCQASRRACHSRTLSRGCTCPALPLPSLPSQHPLNSTTPPPNPVLNMPAMASGRLLQLSALRRRPAPTPS